MYKNDKNNFSSALLLEQYCQSQVFRVSENLSLCISFLTDQKIASSRRLRYEAHAWKTHEGRKGAMNFDGRLCAGSRGGLAWLAGC